MGNSREWVLYYALQPYAFPAGPAFRLFFRRRLPVKEAVLWLLSYGSSAGRRATSTPRGTRTRTVQEPEPVIVTQPSPAMTMSVDDLTQPSPKIFTIDRF